ncbi:glucose dehydrogenase [Xylogone sp. PMI_703]|nr:glucose dehydrogenase [Xylogone sp. PMI_703]
MSTSDFDFIIIGGGTAGCVLASRISAALPSSSIALIEAGGSDDHPAIKPGFSLVPGWKGDIDWKHKSIPQAAADGRRMDQAAGKCLGGSTTINFETWTRGSKFDYDTWAELVDDKSWSWEGMLPWLKRTETFHPSTDYGKVDMSIHGTDGPINVTHIFNSGRPRNYPLRDLTSKIYEQSGCKRVADGNGGDIIGYFELASSTWNGEREWSSKKYKFGSNVRVFTNTAANKLVIENGRAVGVVVQDGDSKESILSAKKEILLSAGCYGSPKVLINSGIGPADHLSQLNIKPVADLPVGKNFSDHLAFETWWKLDQRGVSFGDMPLATAEVDWLSGCPCDWLGFYSLDQLSPSVRELAKKSMTPEEYRVYSQTAIAEVYMLYGHIDCSDIGVENPGGSVFCICMQLLKPLSRGTITLDRSNTNNLVIDTNALQHELDHEVLISLGQVMVGIMTGSFGKENGIHEYGIPESLQGRADRDSIKERIRRSVDTYHHPGGSCSMGSVVDTQCRVKGVNGLRVVDGGVIPFPFAAHYQAIVYGAAEKIAASVIENA